MTEAMKETKNKERVDLIPWPAVQHIASAMEYGAIHYEEHDWRKGQKWVSYGAAILRHTFKWLTGEDFDKESKLHHLAHVASNCVILLTWFVETRGTDDRFKHGGFQEER